MLIGELDLRAGTLRLVSAGHFAPLLVTADGARFLPCLVRPRVGVDRTAPVPVSVDVASPATLVAFTDGLMERAGEVLDVGLERLRAAAEDPAGGFLQDLMDSLIRAALPDDTEDDAVILALRWGAHD